MISTEGGGALFAYYLGTSFIFRVNNIKSLPSGFINFFPRVLDVMNLVFSGAIFSESIILIFFGCFVLFRV